MSARDDLKAVITLADGCYMDSGVPSYTGYVADAVLEWLAGLDIRDRIRSAVRAAEHAHYNASFASRPGLPDERECADTITDAVLAVLAEVGLVTE